MWTTPDYRGCEGYVQATRPVVTVHVRGPVIEGMRLRVAGGRIVEATAATGEEFLHTLLATDPGAAQLGEVALVTRSPLAEIPLPSFYHPLLDENAGSHIAFGLAYPFPVEGAAELSPEERQGRGVSHSSVHQDFVFGGDDVEVVGIGADGSSTPVTACDEWLLS